MKEKKERNEMKLWAKTSNGKGELEMKGQGHFALCLPHYYIWSLGDRQTNVLLEQGRRGGEE